MENSDLVQVFINDKLELYFNKNIINRNRLEFLLEKPDSKEIKIIFADIANEYTTMDMVLDFLKYVLKHIHNTDYHFYHDFIRLKYKSHVMPFLWLRRISNNVGEKLKELLTRVTYSQQLLKNINVEILLKNQTNVFDSTLCYYITNNKKIPQDVLDKKQIHSCEFYLSIYENDEPKLIYLPTIETDPNSYYHERDNYPEPSIKHVEKIVDVCCCDKKCVELQFKCTTIVTEGPYSYSCPLNNDPDWTRAIKIELARKSLQTKNIY